MEGGLSKEDWEGGRDGRWADRGRPRLPAQQWERKALDPKYSDLAGREWRESRGRNDSVRRILVILNNSNNAAKINIGSSWHESFGP